MQYWINIPRFQSSEFLSLLSATGIKGINVGVESHNAIVETERYHAYLRNIYERVRLHHTEMKADIILALAVKACNNTAGPSEMVPTLLVFGFVPRIPVHPDDLPNQRQRMSALHTARSHKPPKYKRYLPRRRNRRYGFNIPRYTRKMGGLFSGHRRK